MSEPSWIDSNRKSEVKGRKLRTMIYSEHFYPSIGGSENYALDLAKELFQQGHSVMVVTSEISNDEESFPFQVIRIHKKFPGKSFNLNFLEIPMLISKFNPDIIHINYQTGGENLLIIMCKLLKKHVVLTYHADHVVLIGRLIDELQMRTTFRLLDFAIVQTERDKFHFLSAGFKEEKLVNFFFNGIDTEKFRCLNNHEKEITDINKGIVVAVLDSSHKYKGIDFLLKALWKFRDNENYKKLQLKVVGDGDLIDFYRKEAEFKQLSNIVFIGNLTEKELIKLYCESDFLIIPATSKGEGFGRVALEGLSCGLRLVISDKAGAIELTRRYSFSGYSFTTNNIDSMLDALESVLKTNTDKEVFSAQVSEMLRQESLTLFDTTRRTIGIYEKALDNSRKGEKWKVS